MVSFKRCYFYPVCIVKRITRSARFTLSVRQSPSSTFAIIRFLIVWVALFTTPFPVCIRGVHHSISIFRFLQNCWYTFEINAPVLSDLIFSGILYKLKLVDRKFITSFVSDVLQIFAVGHLLNLSIAISICVSPLKF